jgi:hypothetical protein
LSMCEKRATRLQPSSSLSAAFSGWNEGRSRAVSGNSRHDEGQQGVVGHEYDLSASRIGGRKLILVYPFLRFCRSLVPKFSRLA